MSQQTKVYLSKSKSGNFDNLMKVKNVLKKLDVVLVEFAGGSYDPRIIDEVDYLIVLPPDVDDLLVGRGQAEEIERAFIKGIGVILITDLSPSFLTIVEIFKENTFLSKVNWQTNWMQFDLEDADVCDFDSLDLWFSPKEEEESIFTPLVLEQLKAREIELSSKTLNDYRADKTIVVKQQTKARPMLATMALLNNIFSA